MKNHIMCTITSSVALLLLPCILLAGSDASFTDNTEISEVTTQQLASLDITLRDLTFPPGYMDRSPKAHRPVSKQFCISCDMDLSKSELFRARAEVVNYFNLSTVDALPLTESSTIASEKKHPRKGLNNKKEQKRISRLRAL